MIRKGDHCRFLQQNEVTKTSTTYYFSLMDLIIKCYDKKIISHILASLTNTNNTWIFKDNNLNPWSLNKLMKPMIENKIRINNDCFVKLELYFINYINKDSEYIECLLRTPFFYSFTHYIKEFDLVNRYTLKLPHNIKGKILAQLL